MNKNNTSDHRRFRPAARLDGVREYYFSSKLRTIARADSSGADIINLGIGSPDAAPAVAVREALNRSASHPGHHAYQSYRGLPDLRRAFAGWCERHLGLTLDPDGELLPLLGSKEGIMHISMACLDEGDEVLVPDPGYPAYGAAARLAGAIVRSYPLTEQAGWRPRLDRLARSDLSRVKMMWVNYPHMPTGAEADEGFFSELVDFARSFGIGLVNDNPYVMLGAGPPLSLLTVAGAREVALELYSLSKSHHMAGWRVGMLAGAPEYIDTVLRFKSNMDSGMFRPVQEGAIAALDMGDSWYRELKSHYHRRRIRAGQLLDRLGCTYPRKQGGMFIWARVPGPWKDGYALSDWLLTEARVFVAPGGVFGSRGESYIRVSLCQPERRIGEAGERIALALKAKSKTTGS